MINTDTLAYLSGKLGLGEYLMINKHVEENVEVEQILEF